MAPVSREKARFAKLGGNVKKKIIELELLDYYLYL